MTALEASGVPNEVGIADALLEDMKISEVMRPGAFTISDHDSLGAAHFAMTRAHIRHLPVMHGDRLVGMLSERDVLAARAYAADEDRTWWALSVCDAMHPSPQTARPDDPLNEVAGRMAAARIGAMPIVERGKLLGIATITDVLDAEVRVAMGPSAVGQLIAAEAMTPWPLTVRPDAPLSDAAALMAQRGFRHLPVVDSTSTIVGMLSERDLREAIGDPLEYLEIRPKLVTAEPRVRDVMTAPALAMRFDAPLAELARKFADQRIGAIPIVDGFGALIGIVSYVDALRLLAA
jgi:CBS domain-containing protein